MKKVYAFLLFIVGILLSAQVKFENDNLHSAEKKVTAAQAVSYIANNDNSTLEVLDLDKFKSKKEDKEAFDELMNSEDQKNKKPITTEVINEMLQSDENDTLSLLLIKNSSHCNMVLDIEGNKTYRIPIPANGQNAIMVEKGMYKLSGNLCELKYEAQKDLNKNILVALKRMNDN